MLTYPAFQDCAIVGIPADMGEEDIRAFVTFKEGQLVDEDAPKDHCADRLVKFMVLKHITVLNEMPRTPTGKPEKDKLALISPQQ